MTELEFNLINMSDIRKEVREIAVAWCERNDRDFIMDKHKLASDIQNYADWYAAQQIDANK
jgi:hypothetical protein